MQMNSVKLAYTELRYNEVPQNVISPARTVSNEVYMRLRYDQLDRLVNIERPMQPSIRYKLVILLYKHHDSVVDAPHCPNLVAEIHGTNTISFLSLN